MEADSTTHENSHKEPDNEPNVPFSCYPDNMMLYKEFVSNNGGKSLESQIVERLQAFGLIPKAIKCPTGNPECRIILKNARVIDRVQWVCEGCGKRLPIRTGSFFLRIQCSLLQALQIILTWCEDADFGNAVQHFGVKPKVASMIYDRLDELAVKEQSKCKLGGEGSVVLTDIYPDCLMQLSPDTTDQPHVHRILMIADTKHVPTHYHLHVIKEDLKKTSGATNTPSFTKEVTEVISQMTESGSTVVAGNNIPAIDSTSTIQQLMQYCDVDMQHFLTTRIWRQAISLCVASRDLCSGPASVVCASNVQRYLLASLYRLRYTDGFYRRVLHLLAEEYTEIYTEEGQGSVNQMSG